jgi:hypothetical protein
MLRVLFKRKFGSLGAVDLLHVVVIATPYTSESLPIFSFEASLLVPRTLFSVALAYLHDCFSLAQRAPAMMPGARSFKRSRLATTPPPTPLHFFPCNLPKTLTFQWRSRSKHLTKLWPSLTRRSHPTRGNRPETPSSIMTSERHRSGDIPKWTERHPSLGLPSHSLVSCSHHASFRCMWA